jgi:pimeloyl-ACP methyl ester carboxylesterase
MPATPSSSRQFRLRSLAAAGLASGLILAGTASAQGGAAGASGFGTGSGTSLFTQATPFSWNETAHDLGPVKVQIGGNGGWVLMPEDLLQWRFIEPWSSDPTIEVIMFPPKSGHPTKAERFLLQFPFYPSTYDMSTVPMVIGFHMFGVSEKNVFNASGLPDICARRGWYLIAPYGMIDTNYFSQPSQATLDAVLALVDKYFTFDAQRIYTVGFSMGGGNAVSYAMRHQDPHGLRVAGVVDHTGTMDLVNTWNQGNTQIQTILENPDVMGGTPASAPYSYESCSPFLLSGTTVNPDKAPVSNLLHIPFYLNVNLDDAANSTLITQTQALRTYLQSKGAQNVKYVAVHGGNVHAWSTLDTPDAIEYLDDFSLPPHPASLTEFADRNARYLYSETRALPPSTIASYKLTKSGTSNAFTIESTKKVETLAVDLVAYGLSASQTLYVTYSSGDATPDTLVLKPYAQSPSNVLLFGVLPPLSWSYDAASKEVRIVPNATGNFAQITVSP